MNKSLLLILAVVAIAAVGWYAWNNGMLDDYLNKAPVPTNQGNENVMESEESNEVVVDLAAQNNSGESGTATLSEVNGQVHVALQIEGAPEGVAQPAHIHLNSCANIGGVKYPLTSVMNGESETTIEASMAELMAGLPLSINVHKSAEEVSVYVACGDIMMP